MKARAKTIREDDVVSLLKQRLPEKTWRHSLSVADFAEQVAGLTGACASKARRAGLLHDMCKGMAPLDLLQHAEKYGVEVSTIARQKPALLHGPVAAEMCRRELGICDADVYEAIYWHTTGKSGLGKVALSVILADFAEPLREYPEARVARELLEQHGLWFALQYVAQQKLEHARLKQPVDPHTEAFVEWLQQGEWCVENA